MIKARISVIPSQATHASKAFKTFEKKTRWISLGFSLSNLGGSCIRRAHPATPPYRSWSLALLGWVGCCRMGVLVLGGL